MNVGDAKAKRVTANYVFAATVSDLQVNRGFQFDLPSSKSAAIFKTPAGGIVVFDNRCAHQGGPLAEGDIEEVAECGGLAVLCPLHGWAFALKDGACLQMEGYRQPQIPFKIEGDKLYLKDVKEEVLSDDDFD